MGAVSSFLTKIITYNIMGLGGRMKKREIKQMVMSQKHDLVCLQYSKLASVDRSLCSQLWDGDDFEWVAKLADGRSGGLIILWSKLCFQLSDTFEGGHFLGLEGWRGAEKVRVSILNVHAPCDARGKTELWGEVVNQKVCCGGER